MDKVELTGPLSGRWAVMILLVALLVGLIYETVHSGVIVREVTGDNAVSYLYDSRTKLCFAEVPMATVVVTCTPEVMALVTGRETHK